MRIYELNANDANIPIFFSMVFYQLPCYQGYQLPGGLPITGENNLHLIIKKFPIHLISNSPNKIFNSWILLDN